MNEIAIFLADTYHGDEIYWGPVRVRLGAGYFVARNSNKQLIIGFREHTREPFPKNNVIVLAEPPFEYSVYKDGLVKLCQIRACDPFSVGTETLGKYHMEYVQAGTNLQSSAANSHAFFYQRELNLLISYDGSTEAFKYFDTVMNSIRQSITEISTERT